MSRSDKDRPYAVKLAEARKLGKVKRVAYIRGKYSDRTLASYPDHKLSTVILKGDTAKVTAYRKFLETLDVHVVENEIKIPLFALQCYAEENKHNNGETLYQRNSPSHASLAKDFPVLKYLEKPSCCYTKTITVRTGIEFVVNRWIQSTPVVDFYDDYDQRIISFSSPSKRNDAEHSYRHQTKHVLNNLLRSNSIDEDWDDNTNLDQSFHRSYWNW